MEIIKLHQVYDEFHNCIGAALEILKLAFLVVRNHVAIVVMEVWNEKQE